MKVKTLAKFSQARVDSSLEETLYVDKSYGGYNPYTIGTILRDTDGSFIYWSNGVSSHRLCIEHSPDEYVDYWIISGASTVTEKYLTQITGNEFAEINRAGVIPLTAPIGVSSGLSCRLAPYQLTSDDLVNNSRFRFYLPSSVSMIDLTNETSNANPKYYEFDSFNVRSYIGYLIDIYTISSNTDYVLYVVYKKHDGLFKGTCVLDSVSNKATAWCALNSYRCYLKEVFSPNIGGQRSDMTIKVRTYTAGGGDSLLYSGSSYNAVSMSDYPAYWVNNLNREMWYGATVQVELPPSQHGAPVYFRTTRSLA